MAGYSETAMLALKKATARLQYNTTASA